MSLLGGRFGTVDKAAFLIGKKQKDDGSWEYEKPVEVLINPERLKVSATVQVKREEGVANESTSSAQNADGKITPKGITEESVDMTLIFNVVEAYNAKTEGAQFKALAAAAKSLIGSAFNGNRSGQQDGLHQPEHPESEDQLLHTAAGGGPQADTCHFLLGKPHVCGADYQIPDHF